MLLFSICYYSLDVVGPHLFNQTLSCLRFFYPTAHMVPPVLHIASSTLVRFLALLRPNFTLASPVLSLASRPWAVRSISGPPHDATVSLGRVCVFSSHSIWTSSSLDVPAGVTQEEGRTGFLIHLLSAVEYINSGCGCRLLVGVTLSLVSSAPPLLSLRRFPGPLSSCSVSFPLPFPSPNPTLSPLPFPPSHPWCPVPFTEASGYLQTPPPGYRYDAACVMTVPDLPLCFFLDVADVANSRTLFLPSPLSILVPVPIPVPVPAPSRSSSPFASSFAPSRPWDLVLPSVLCACTGNGHCGRSCWALAIDTACLQ